MEMEVFSEAIYKYIMECLLRPQNRCIAHPPTSDRFWDIESRAQNGPMKSIPLRLLFPCHFHRTCLLTVQTRHLSREVIPPLTLRPRASERCTQSCIVMGQIKHILR
jgi:hypothetical protein